VALWPEKAVLASALGASIIVPKQIHARNAYKATACRNDAGCVWMMVRASTADLCWAIHSIIQCWVIHSMIQSGMIHSIIIQCMLGDPQHNSMLGDPQNNSMLGEPQKNSMLGDPQQNLMLDLHIYIQRICWMIVVEHGAEVM